MEMHTSPARSWGEAVLPSASREGRNAPKIFLPSRSSSPMWSKRSNWRRLYSLSVENSVTDSFKFRTELQIHAKMHHPGIVEFYRAFAFENHTYVVLELCPNGSLMDMVKNRKSLTLPEVRRYMIQLCGGVKYMHQRSVIHRDLKMGNIFIDAHMNIKIGDFGLAAVVVDDNARRTTMCGTPNYIAPELLARASSGGHGHKVDTWAIGIICYAMLIGSPPFASKSQNEIYAKLKQLQYEWKEDCQYFVPSQAKDLVTLCLNLVPEQRPGMDDLIEHEFFKMGAIAEELDRSCLRSTPTWLEHADPRGDKTRAGYGVDHVAMCEACGVGKTSKGQPRPSVGGNLKMTAYAEVDLETRNLLQLKRIGMLPESVLWQPLK
jgi:serine/threonine protein kinase